MAKKNRDERSKPAQAAPTQSRFADYFWANVVFFGFILVLGAIVRQSCASPGDDPSVTRVLDQAFHYLLLLFGGGFLLVTLFDAAYEFFAARSGESESGGETGA